MSDIFLSYAKEDREFAAHLAKALGEHCRPVWWDDRLLPGDPFRDKIRKALGEAKCVVVIWSAASAGRSYVISEAKNGLKRNILVPLIINGTEQPGQCLPGPGRRSLPPRFRDGCLFLLDGLDEIPGDAAREEITDVLRASGLGYPELEIVATSRPGVYGGVTSIRGFVSVKIAPLDDEAIGKFAEKWGHAVHPTDTAAAAELTSALLQEINAKVEIRRMAGNPVMLTALACLKFSRTRLPEQRSELYDSVLEWLAKARQAKTGLDHYVLLGRMRKLAYAMHTAQRHTWSQMERYEAIGVLEGEFRQEADQAGKRRAAERFLKEEEINSGIIVNDAD